MAIVQNLTEMCDIVSVVINQTSDNSFVIASKPRDEQHKSGPTVLSLPATRVDRDRWTNTAIDLVTLVVGKPPPTFNCVKLLKIIRIWVPDHANSRFFHHIVYHTQIGKTKLPKYRTITGTTRWMQPNELVTAYESSNLSSPEIFTLIRMSIGENKNVNIEMKQLGPETLWTGLANDFSQNEDIVSEVTDDDILESVNNTNVSHVELLKSALIHTKEQRMLYRDFLYSCFPYLYMNSISFTSNISRLLPNFSLDECHALFRYKFSNFNWTHLKTLIFFQRSRCHQTWIDNIQ